MSRDERGSENNHPTVKPLDLMRYLIRIYSPPNSIVLDPFCGSGTTGIASIHEDREFVGVDISENYANYAENALHDAYQSKQQSIDTGKSAK